MVAGEAGIGKTALWLAAVEEAAARGFLVLSCRPSEAEARFSFSGLADLVGGVVGELLPELPGSQRRALEAALALSDAEGPVDEGVVAFAFLSVLRRLAVESRVLVAVDDLQWLDTPSLALLRYALPRFEAEPVAVLLTARGEVPSWLRRERPFELELGPLSVGALHVLLRSRLDAALPRPTLLRIWETSAGNPFFALELARALQRRGRTLLPGEELPIPPTLDGLLQERLDGLSPSALAAARVVAALAEPTVRLVSAAGGAEDGIAEACEAGVFELDGERLRFTHPLLGSSISSRSTLTERRRLHARLAELVTDDEERARHLALAAAGPSGTAASALEDAAQAAYARGAPASAAELAEQALRLTPAADAEAIRRRAIFAADRLWRIFDNRRAIAVLEPVCAAAPPGPERATLLLHLAEPTFSVHGFQEAVRLCEEALVEAMGDDALEAEVHLALAWLGGFGAGSGLEHAELALAAATRAGDPELRCAALGLVAFERFFAGRGVAHRELEEALELERTKPERPSSRGSFLIGRHISRASWLVGHQLVWSGDDLDGARRYCQAYAQASDNPPELSDPPWWLTVVEWRAGNWELAARAADELFAAGLIEDEASIVNLVPALVDASQGRLAEARGRIERCLARAEEKGLRRYQPKFLSVLGFVELSLGNAAAALEHLRRAWAIGDELGYFEPGHRLELADTLEALIAVGELDDAERRLGPWEERCRALDRAWAIANLARCRALLFAARGDLAASFAAFDEALVQHGRNEFPFDRGRTLLALGATQRRAKRRAAARATLEQALAIFEELGAPLWAAKARAELARIGGRTPSRGELTEAERRIAALVAEGRTNREVSAALFITEQTVATALTRVYRKLGVRSRTELARRLARENAEA